MVIGTNFNVPELALLREAMHKKICQKSDAENWLDLNAYVPTQCDSLTHIDSRQFGLASK